MRSYVEITIDNSANTSSAILSDPYISMIGSVNNIEQNLYIADDGTCSTDSGHGQMVVQLSSLSGPLKLDSDLSIEHGRIYVTSSSAAVTSSGVDPTTADYYYDWIEFALNAGSANQLVVNTTQVDQFGLPLILTIDPPDANFGATAGCQLTRDEVLARFQTELPASWHDCLLPVSGSIPASYYRILSPNMALVRNPSSILATVFTTAIDDVFNCYAKKPLYLNSVQAYPYQAQVTTSRQTGTDNQQHDYPVLQFNFAAAAPVNPGMITPPPSGSGPYNIYYPFFTSNNPAGHTSFDGNPILPPPHWWTTSISGAGQLNPSESPSQMVLAGNGIFADTFWQLGLTNAIPTAQADVLGNLENQVNAAFNRGYAGTWLTLTGSIASSDVPDPQTGLYTSTVTLGSTYTDQDTPNTCANLRVGMYVLSFAANIPLKISSIPSPSSTSFFVTSSQKILPQNDLYLTFADFYPSGVACNAYVQFFHQTDVSIGGRAYAFSFDDQGGFSSTLTSNWGTTPSTLTITIGAC